MWGTFLPTIRQATRHSTFIRWLQIQITRQPTPTLCATKYGQQYISALRYPTFDIFSRFPLRLNNLIYYLISQRVKIHWHKGLEVFRPAHGFLIIWYFCWSALLGVVILYITDVEKLWYKTLYANWLRLCLSKMFVLCNDHYIVGKKRHLCA